MEKEQRQRFILCRNCGFGCGTEKREKWGITDEDGFPMFGEYCSYWCSHAADLEILQKSLKSARFLRIPHRGDDEVLDALYAFFCKFHLRSHWVTPTPEIIARFERWAEPAAATGSDLGERE